MNHVKRLIIIAGIYSFFATKVMAMDASIPAHLKSMAEDINQVFVTYKQEVGENHGLMSLETKRALANNREIVWVIETVWENYARVKAFYCSNSHQELEKLMGKPIETDKKEHVEDENKPIRVLNKYNMFTKSLELITSNS
jgi:hypothetical protein